MRIILALILSVVMASPVMADTARCPQHISKIDMSKVVVMGVRNPTWYCDRFLTFRYETDTPQEWAKKQRKRKAVQNGSIWIGRVAIMLILPVPVFPIACAVPTTTGWAVFLHERHVKNGKFKNPRSFIPRHELSHVACDQSVWKK